MKLIKFKYELANGESTSFAFNAEAVETLVRLSETETRVRTVTGDCFNVPMKFDELFNLITSVCKE